jgi:hypothetical protein
MVLHQGHASYLEACHQVALGTFDDTVLHLELTSAGDHQQTEVGNQERVGA